jgi:3,4-dihydroxy 2-butanone 4-phosphate synthase/GTP cyclohydrolase II
MGTSIQQALEDLKQGKMIIVTDDEHRENEGDLVCAADAVTPEIINFMAKEGRGLICVPMKQELAARLNFHPMVPNPNGNCNFTVSVDAFEGTTTGISAFDRHATVRRMLDPKATPEDFMRPGHVFPLIAEAGGVLERPGHTEATVDLAGLAGLTPMGVICEILNDDGRMARLPDLERFAKKHGLNLYTIRDLITYRQTLMFSDVNLRCVRIRKRATAL